MSRSGSKTGDAGHEMTIEDQREINTFANLNIKYREMKYDLDQKIKQQENMKDALEAVGEAALLSDEDNCLFPYKVGDVFIHSSEEQIERYINESQEKLKESIKKTELDIEESKRKMTALKSSLYEKFGNKINLEDGDDP